MATLFGPSEVIDLGIEKEKKRRDFYASVAERFPEPEMKDLFSRLRDWEDTHIEKFARIREGLQQTETRQSYTGETQSYMNALVDDRLYDEISPERFSQTVKTPLAAVRYGMSFEKDAILFFSEFLPLVADTRKDVIRELIEEEKQHLVYLHQMKVDLSG